MISFLILLAYSQTKVIKAPNYTITFSSFVNGAILKWLYQKLLETLVYSTNVRCPLLFFYQLL